MMFNKSLCDGKMPHWEILYGKILKISKLLPSCNCWGQAISQEVGSFSNHVQLPYQGQHDAKVGTSDGPHLDKEAQVILRRQPKPSVFLVINDNPYGLMLSLSLYEGIFCC
jgi:hypothetical protein